MLGQPISMLIPEVIGFRLTGTLAEGTTATDLVLTVTQMLRKKGVVGKFVEFFGPGLAHLSLEDMATIANMAPEYGATCGFFPVSAETLDYQQSTGRPAAQIALVEKYAKAQGMLWTPTSPEPVFTDTLELDLARCRAVARRPQAPAGPGDAQDRRAGLRQGDDGGISRRATNSRKRYPVEGANFDLGHGDVVIAAITSCTNTSNPIVMIGGRAPRAQCRQGGPAGQALGQDLACARQPGGHRISQVVRPAEGSRQARLRSRRLWLHHLHRQFGTAAGTDFGSDPQARSRRRGGAFRQPQFRRPRQSRCARQLSGLAAARRRLCAGGLAQCRSCARIRSACRRRASPSISATSGRGQGDRRLRAQAT